MRSLTPYPVHLSDQQRCVQLLNGPVRVRILPEYFSLWYLELTQGEHRSLIDRGSCIAQRQNRVALRTLTAALPTQTGSAVEGGVEGLRLAFVLRCSFRDCQVQSGLGWRVGGRVSKTQAAALAKTVFNGCPGHLWTSETAAERSRSSLLR